MKAKNSEELNNRSKRYRCCEIIDALGLSEKTIKSCEKKGLISKVVEDDDGEAEYSSVDFIRLKVVMRYASTGYTLDEIKELMGGARPLGEDINQIERIYKYINDKLYYISHRQSVAEDQLERINLQCDEALLKEYMKELQMI